MVIEERMPEDPGLAWLLDAAFAELVPRYTTGRPSTVRRDARYLVAVADGRPVACGAVQPTHDPRLAELKRLYVTPLARGRGVARTLLSELERLAAGLGHVRLRLATAADRPAALALYEGAGYARTEPYGPYTARRPSSICFSRTLPVPQPRPAEAGGPGS